MSDQKDLQEQVTSHLRSESDLLIFISSVTDELKSTRQAAKDAVLALPFAQPWLFEDSPASSESPSAIYLRKVKEADIVIWFIGSETSKPVVEEINVCMNVGHPLLAFKLPFQNRDDQTQKLISEVGQYATWKEIGHARKLSEEINVALYDEMLRRFRNPKSPALKWTQSFGQESRLVKLEPSTPIHCQAGTSSGVRLTSDWCTWFLPSSNTWAGVL